MVDQFDNIETSGSLEDTSGESDTKESSRLFADSYLASEAGRGNFCANKETQVAPLIADERSPSVLSPAWRFQKEGEQVGSFYDAGLKLGNAAAKGGPRNYYAGQQAGMRPLSKFELSSDQQTEQA
ncbi:MAG: hypothetical protein K8F91_10735 [Candidatus Obscuribacterales bacterium]|nr:hypothetical protein [Candidatus Obscuribacterales bacterium]